MHLGRSSYAKTTCKHQKSKKKTNRQMDEWTDGWMDKKMDGQMNGQMDGVGRTVACMCPKKRKLANVFRGIRSHHPVLWW